ncbi:MAG: hypothetical protein ACI97N_000366 [Cognaticolwellia sp.]|jgi:hypothetical protein
MSIIKYTLLLLITVVSVNLTAQEIEKNMFKPFGENANSCYGNVLMPSVYDTIVDRVEVKASYTYLKRMPPIFDTIAETIIVRPGYTKYQVVEPIFETETVKIKRKDAESVIGKDSYTATRVLKDKIEAKPSVKVWTKTKRKRNCRSSIPENCLTWRVQTLPSESIVLEREFPATLVKGRSNIEQIPEEYITIIKTILKQEGSVKEVNVLPEYKEVIRYVKKRNASFEEITVPAVYKEVKRIRLISEGGNIEPLEVVCPKEYSEYIRPLQLKLQDLGYEVEMLDGILGRKTKDALLKYQVDNNLPVGQLDFKTMRRLGFAK